MVTGFRKLPIAEQITVVQNSMYPMVVCVLSVDFNTSTQSFNYFNFSDKERDTVWHFFPEFKELHPTFLDVGQAIKEVNLDRIEMGFLCGIRLLQEGM